MMKNDDIEEENKNIVQENNKIEGENNTNDDGIVNLGYEKLDDDMKSILKKPPGYAIYSNINEINVKIALEGCIDKMHWDNLKDPNNSVENVNKSSENYFDREST